ncbi:Imm32 family immunity protein [Fastidiosibacter lacustris]|uniref:Imm32 family immunity protein n=1 Tax=Fastidiosibacter lacustris TaxID=2056695 RepID=UPI000E34DC8A|nr:Imm32 family immunity protein [Fastidiosibacter lacustris]
MTTDSFLLSFEISKDGNELDIHCDDNGLEKLLSLLSLLKGKAQHEHLMTPSWGGGYELSEEPQSEGSQLLHKVTIHKW